MTERPVENHFRHLPEPVHLEGLVETVDTTQLPARDEAGEERDRLLRRAAG